MTRSSLALVVVVLVMAPLFVRSTVARAQGPARIEYLRITPYLERIPTGTKSVEERMGYWACAAAASEWTCRQFPPTVSSTDALRTALVTLGNDGWELVSAVQEDPSIGTRGLQYLFKRSAR